MSETKINQLESKCLHVSLSFLNVVHVPVPKWSGPAPERAQARVGADSEPPRKNTGKGARPQRQGPTGARVPLASTGSLKEGNTPRLKVTLFLTTEQEN